MNNLEIAELLRNVAAAYQLQDEKINKFKIIAYERAADAIEHLSSEVKDLWDEGKLDDIPSIGPNIAGHLDELFRTGKSTHFEKLLKNIPEKAFKLMALPKVGIKTAVKMLGELSSVEITNKLREVDRLKAKNSRHLLPYAINIANEVINWLKGGGQIIQAEALGSLRRHNSTVGDIDIAVTSTNPSQAIKHFVAYSKKNKIIEQGDRTASILLPGNVQVDLMVADPDSFGSLLQHFTGSKHHNIALREFSLKKGYSMSEYGIKDQKSKLRKFKTEHDLYKYLGLQYIPPELREDSGEIEAARENKIPKLLELFDIKADLHLHSDFNIETSHDLGISSAKDLISKADNLGYEYLAFTEHNPSKSQHSETDIVALIKDKRKYVDEINYSIVKDMKGRVKKVYNSLEVDIASDGQLSIPDASFQYLDFILVSIHSVFNQTKDEATKRVLRALSYPKVKIFAHPTTRKLNEREGIEFDWSKIFTYCVEHDIWLEINADPMRLDLPDFLVRDAVNAGVKLTLGTDSHLVDGMSNMIYGVYTAQRGWAKRSDIINSLSQVEFDQRLKAR